MLGFWDGSFGFEGLWSPVTGYHLTLSTVKLTECAKVQARARTYARVCKYIHTHVCTFWQVQFLTSYYCSNPSTPTTHTHTYFPSHMHSQTRVYPPAHPALPHLTHKQPGICHRGGHTYTPTRTHANTNTPRHTTQSCCLHPAYPFDPLTGTRRISKWEEKPRSRSTSQRRALSIGSCLTPQGSRGRRCLSQEAITLLSGSEVCLECYLHLSGREAGGQEVRQEWDHLYHVLCMTGGMCLNIYMCLKVMQIERGIKEGGSSENCDSFVNKDCL